MDMKNILLQGKRNSFLFVASFISLLTSAQFSTVTLDSDIGTDEYGTSNANNYTSGTPTWYMTWDDTYLYISIQNANETEAGIVYLDLTPATPVNGSTGATGGSTSGDSYDGLGAPNLPFSANTVLYFKNNYREIKRYNGSTWSTVTSGNGGFGGGSDDYSDGYYSSNTRGNGAGSDDDRELKISWCTLTGGSSSCRPSSFNWLGYIAYSNGLYGQVPIENPSGSYSGGTVLAELRYFTIESTSNSSSTNPLSLNSYTHPDADNSSFGSISVYDFTMNQNSRTITRSSGDWTISGDLRIDNGTISFGTTSDACTVSGNLTNSGTLTLSSTSGGDITLQGNLTDNGTFNSNNRAIFFTGTNTQSIQGSGTFDIAYVRINKTSGSVVLNSNLVCAGPNGGNCMELNSTTSILDLNGYTLTLGQTTGTTSATYNDGVATPGFLKGSSTSILNILGTGTFGDIQFDQSSSGSTNLLQNLTFNRSSATIGLANELQIIGTVTHTDGTLETNNNLKLIASGSTTYGQIAGTGTGNISEAVSMQMIIPGSTGGWRNFSVPFDTITPGQLGNQIKLAMSNSTSINGDFYDQNLFSWTENGASWTAISNSSSNLYGSGLNLYVFDPSATTITLAGNYSSSTKNYGNLTNRASGTASKDGWHLLANPYPSGIDWNATTKQSGMNGNYAVYSVADGTYRPWNGTTGSAGQYIPPMHAFWVKVNSTLSSDFEISTGNRVTNTVNHFQKGNTLANNIVVDVKSPFNTYKDQVILYSEPQLDPMHRANAQKLLGLNEAPNIWIVFNANKQSILPLAETELDQILPLGFKCSLDGSYTFNFSVENLGIEQGAWLEDRQEKVWHNMEKGDYSFSHKANDPMEGRFFIHYKNEMTAINETAINSVNYWVGQNENDLIVSVDEAVTLVLYDLSGRKLLQQKLETGIHAIPATKWNGFILVELTGETGMKTFKIIR